MSCVEQWTHAHAAWRGGLRSNARHTHQLVDPLCFLRLLFLALYAQGKLRGSVPLAPATQAGYVGVILIVKPRFLGLGRPALGHAGALTVSASSVLFETRPPSWGLNFLIKLI